MGRELALVSEMPEKLGDRIGHRMAPGRGSGGRSTAHSSTDASSTCAPSAWNSFPHDTHFR
jgi:hypothetical protein